MIHHPPTSRSSIQERILRPLPEFQNIQNMNLALLKETYPNVSFNLPMLAKEFNHLRVRDPKDDEVPMYPRSSRRQLVNRITEPIFWSHEGELKIYAPILTCTIEAQGRMVNSTMMVVQV